MSNLPCILWNSLMFYSACTKSILFWVTEPRDYDPCCELPARFSGIISPCLFSKFSSVFLLRQNSGYLRQRFNLSDTNARKYQETGCRRSSKHHILRCLHQDWVTSLSLSLSKISLHCGNHLVHFWERKSQTTAQASEKFSCLCAHWGGLGVNAVIMGMGPAGTHPWLTCGHLAAGGNGQNANSLVFSL